VKAAFLFHFAQFVEWPREVLDVGGAPLTYCTVGEDPFQGALEATLNGKRIDTHPLQVRHFKQIQDVQGCQVLFIGTQKKPIADLLAALESSPVLTVGDSEHFVEQGGMIGFCLEDKKMRFEINLRAAENAKLKVSARLLALAKDVIRGPKGT
jgi:hypothetical protein